jgi:predicted esterase
MSPLRSAFARAVPVCLLASLVSLGGCRTGGDGRLDVAPAAATASGAAGPGSTSPPEGPPATAEAPASVTTAAPAAPPEEPSVEEYTAEGAFFVRGSRRRGQAVLFGGQCAQPQGYIDAIKVAASRRVQLVALRGDKECTGDYRGWKFDLEALSRRIDRTFRGLSLGEPRDVLLIGYSQGASVAELLAAREPEKFTRVVLIAKPSRPEPWHFKGVKSVVTMAGTRDAQQLMIQGSRTLSAAGVRARYFPLPGAAHGYMGDDPEGTFDEVLGWLYQE